MEFLKEPVNLRDKKHLVSAFITLFLLLAIPATVIGVLRVRELKTRAVGENITVDYTTVKRAVSPIQFSMDESHYGGGKILTNDTIQQANIKKLGVAQMRIDLGYKTPGDPNSGIVCYADGCNQSISGLAWVNAVRAAGAEPEIKVRMSTTQGSQNWAADAANMVRYFNTTPGITPVKRWILGNEPDNNGISDTAYGNGFVAMYKAMKAVDSTIEIGGPANAWYNKTYIQNVLVILNNNNIKPNFVDFHSYGMGGTDVKTDADLLSKTISYETNANDLRNLLISIFGTTETSKIDIEMGEWNMSWSADSRMLTHFNTVWSASALGHMVNAGELSRQYADKNGDLGALCESSPETNGSVTYNCNIGDPMPIYHGMGMFTGESLFPRFGTSLVSSNTTLANVEVYASDNPKNIVVINKDPSTTKAATIGLNGVNSGTVDVWQKGPSDKAPIKQTSVAINSGSFSYDLAPYTIYTFLVTSGAPSPMTVSVTSPASGSTVSGNVNVVGTASSVAGTITKVEFYVDDGLKSTSTTSPYSYPWDSKTVADGSYTISAKAYDSAGNVATSAPVSVTVSNAPKAYLWCEAEKSSLASPMVSGTDSTASNGVYIYTTVSDSTNVPPTTTGAATLSFNISEAGMYTFWSRTNYGGEFQNSYLLQFDGGTLYKVGNENTGYSTWKWVDWYNGDVSTTNIVKVSLTAGNHTLKVIGREANTRIDKFLLTTDAAYTPTGQGDADNCGGGDSTLPTVTITAPANGSTVSGTVNVTANATDNVGVARVEFYVDSVLKNTDTTSPYSFPWDSTTVVNGSHTIDAKAFDTSGNNALDSVTVTAKNGDTSAPSTPTNLTATAAAYNKVNLSWVASTDNVGVIGYWIIRGGVTIASSTTNSFSDTSVSPKTTYSYQVVAYDAANNNSAASNTATVATPDAPDGQAPTVPTNLAASVVSSTQINLSWTASTDNVGVTGYDVYRNSTKVATVTTTTFGDTSLTPSTTYSYYVKARDAAGNLSGASNTVSATTQAPPSNLGNITGTVSSSAGGVVAGTKISLTVNGSKKTYVTTSLGVYTITNLPAGIYTLKFSATKYISQTVSVTVTANTTVTKNITLQKR